MSLRLVSDYKNDDFLRKSFNDLAKKIFNISFENWYQKGLWRNNFICYSYFDDNKIAANVSITRLKLKIGEEEKKLIQIGTVMTESNYRGRGLAKELMEYVLKEYEDKVNGFFLFANNSVLDFYPKFGFIRKKRGQFYTNDNFVREPGYQFKKLNMDNEFDIEILIEIVQSRVPTSDKFFVLNSEEILYWYCLEIFKNNIYYCKEECLIVICSVAGGILHIYDVISKKRIDYRKILASFQRENITETVFYFTLETDSFNLRRRIYDEVKEDDYLFVIGGFNLENFTYPITAHT